MTTNNVSNSSDTQKQISSKAAVTASHQDLNSLNSKVTTMENTNLEMKKNIDELYSNINQINENMKILINKFDYIAEEQLKVKKEPEVKNLSKNTVTHSLRTLLVNIISGVYAVTDKTAEVFSGVAENVEDIVAEAQYNNKQRRIQKNQEQIQES